MPMWEGFLECWEDMVSRTENRSQVTDFLRTHEEYTKPETTKHLLSIGPGKGCIKMAMWEGFLECWKDFVSRVDRQSRVLDFLTTHEEYTKPETTKHLLSIGAGTGEIDHGLVTLLPHLKSYTAVEPDIRALDTLKERMDGFPNIEKHYVNGRMQTYTGPRYGADLILMSHVAYHFADSFTQQISRALTWLNKGGRILLVHCTSGYNKLLVSEFDFHWDFILVEDMRHQLVDMGVKYTESAIDCAMDVSHPGPTYFGFMSVILNRRATKEETDKGLHIVRQFLIPGTQKAQDGQALFVIQNTADIQD